MIVSVFPDLYSKEVSYKQAKEVLDAFKSRGEHQSTIEKIRASKDKSERDELKKTLPIICFGGKFTERKKEGLDYASGILVLDFDEGDLKGKREKLEKWNCTYACFSSPSGGERFKALIRIPQVENDEEYKRYFNFFEERYKMLDKSGKDISRACFVTHDSNTYINENAKVFTKEMLGKYGSRPKPQTDIKLLNTIADWIRHAPKGQRNYECCKSAYYCGGLIASGQLEENIAYKTLELAAIERGGEIEQSKTAIKESIEAGKRQPILNMQELERKIRSMTKKVDITSFLMTDDDLDDEIEDFYEDRKVYGRGVDIENFDHFWRYRDNTFCFIISGKGQGKTTTVLFLLLLDAMKNDKKYIIGLFENTPSAGRNILISFYLDKFAKHVYKNHRAAYEAAKEKIGKHFTFIAPNKAEGELYFNDVLDAATQINRKEKHDGLFIDPINAVPVPTDVKNEYRYMVDCGIKAKKFATNVMSLYLTGHPNSSKQREGNAPKDVDAEGGGTFPNKADITATLFRDAYGEDEAKYITDMRVTKVRDKEMFGGDETLDNFPIRFIFDRGGYGFKLACPYPDTAGYAPMEKIKVK